ncbi:MAG TPA: gas vesicle protein [Terriglobales bacterium]|nr:gas vesicle protein [Terriglobales bacterium]
MTTKPRRGAFERAKPALFQDADATLLDLVDNILTKGVVIDAEVVLGLAGVDLVYLRLSALLVAVDKLRRVL